MRRYWLRLVLLAALVVGTGIAILALGHSGTAVVLGMVLTAALCWAPALLALEGLSRTRRYGPDA